MKGAIFSKRLLLSCIGVMFVVAVWAQDETASRPSPPATATGKVGGGTITITYSSPGVKGRKVFGELVPYGKVWRAGANEATLFETDKAIKIGGKSIPAGKYSLYAIPTPNQWTIILNSETGQWGVTRGGNTTRDPDLDVVMATAKSTNISAFNERLVYKVSSKGFSLIWENTEVFIPVR